MISYEQIKKFCGYSGGYKATEYPFRLADGSVLATDAKVMVVLKECGGLSGLPADMFSPANPPDIRKALGAIGPEVVSVELVEAIDINGMAKTEMSIESVTLGDCMIDAKYLRLMAALPGCCLLLNSEPKSPQRFEFDGGFGAVMPLDPDGIILDEE